MKVREEKETSIIPEYPEEIFPLFNIIREGDVVSSFSMRVIKVGEREERKKVKIKLCVEKKKIEFGKLRLTGKVIECPEEGIKGRYHTIEVTPGKEITLHRKLTRWERKYLEKFTYKFPPILLVAADFGQATFALLTKNGVKVVGELHFPIPAKDDENYEKAREGFIKKLKETIQKYKEEHKAKFVVFGGCGFLNDYVDEKIKVKINSVGITGINEILKQASKLIAREAKMMEEIDILQDFFSKESRGLAVYGIEAVKKALEYGAVDILLISEKLLRDYQISGRIEELIELMEAAERVRAKVEFISEKHELGEMFSHFGVGAILRFPL